MRRLSILKSSMFACRVCSRAVATVHFSLIKAGVARSIVRPANPVLELSQLKYSWEVRFQRRLISVLVRSPLRAKVLRLVKVNLDLPREGCVILTCHTPWKRLLVQWCLQNNFALIIAQGKWKKNGVIQSDCRGSGEIRKLISYLKNNGRVVVALDVFNNKNDCPVSFQGRECNASTLPVRLARLASVPLITIFPVYNKGNVQFIEGMYIKSSNHSIPSLVIREIIDDLKELIKKNPVICP